MFKKRGNVSNKVNLKAQLEEITTNINPDIPQYNQDIKPRFSMTIEIDQQVDNLNRIKGSSQYQIMQTIDNQQQEKQQVKYNYYDESNRSHEINLYNYAQESKQHINLMEIEEVIQISDQSNQQPQAPSKYKDQPDKKVMIIQDESGNQVQILPIIQDIKGGLDHEQDYQDQIIKRALTKQNYQKLIKNQTKPIPKQSKYKRLINKISRQSVTNEINKQIQKSQLNLKGLKQKIDYHKQLSNNISKKLKLKTLTHERHLQQFQKVQKILKLIYYRASQIRQFTLQGLMNQIEQQQQYIQ